jgi:hypothetical protein
MCSLCKVYCKEPHITSYFPQTELIRNPLLPSILPSTNCNDLLRTQVTRFIIQTQAYCQTHGSLSQLLSLVKPPPRRKSKFHSSYITSLFSILSCTYEININVHQKNYIPILQY